MLFQKLMPLTKEDSKQCLTWDIQYGSIIIHCHLCVITQHKPQSIHTNKKIYRNNYIHGHMIDVNAVIFTKAPINPPFPWNKHKCYHELTFSSLYSIYLIRRNMSSGLYYSLKKWCQLFHNLYTQPDKWDGLFHNVDDRFDASHSGYHLCMSIKINGQ